MTKLSNIKIAFFLATLFFLIGLLTLSHYGINWDTINHLPRGQAYLHYFLTGKADFIDLEKWSFYHQKPEDLLISTDIPLSQVPKRSIYESDGTTFNWFIEHDGNGHPPVSDILSAVFNQVFFKQLRLINDIDSYRLYSLFLASALLFLIFIWTSKIYGKIAGLIAALSLAIYPLFWSELHFNNEKDVPETVYWSFMLFTLWKGVVEKKLKWILLSGLFFGLALGTKFNILFSAFVIIPWIIVWFLVSNFKKDNFRFILKLSLIPVIGISAFFASWPYLWSDPLSGIMKVIGFYKEIGLTTNQDLRFLGPLGINTYPIKEIIYTTPLVVLLLAFLGIVFAISRIKSEKDKVSFLLLLWLLVPIARVSWPGTTIYGGIRQIMEYIPPVVIFAGLGGMYLCNFALRFLGQQIAPKILISFLIILSFSPIVYKLIQIHPNENVYFNPLIGGLKGAKEQDFPAWGNSFGASYRQGVVWINKNAGSNANVVLVNELLPNIPAIFFRKDINYQNRNRSGYLRQGEYAMTLVYQGVGTRSYYDEYLEKFIQPVYEAKVDDTAVLKIWKNDSQHLKLNLKESVFTGVKVVKTQQGLRFDLGQTKNLDRLEIQYDQNSCQELSSGYVRISANGKDWNNLIGVLPSYWKVSVSGPQPYGGGFIEPFVGQSAQFIDLVLTPTDTCLTHIKNLKLYIFE